VRLASGEALLPVFPHLPPGRRADGVHAPDRPSAVALCDPRVSPTGVGCIPHPQPYKERDMEGSKQSRDLYAEVTRRIVEAIERGVRPWSRPWTPSQSAAGMLPRRYNGEAYRGVNVLLLWGAALERGYTAQTWLTFRQAQAEGGQVRKGERGTTVVFAGQFAPAGSKSEDDDEAPARLGRGYLRSYTVFNIEQVDGLAMATASAPADAPTVDGTSKSFIEQTGAVVQHGGDRAFYAPGLDVVQVPHAHQFRDVAAYLGTVAARRLPCDRGVPGSDGRHLL